MRAQTILFLLVDRVRGKLDCRPYRDGGEGNPKRLVEAASLAFSNRANFLTIRDVFVHFKAIRGTGYRSLNEGDKVEFGVMQGKQGMQASDVVVIH
jgi:CspA family cold shock protein